ncbi:MAG: phosphatase PAP2 family protein [Micavibrio sp.]
MKDAFGIYKNILLASLLYGAVVTIASFALGGGAAQFFQVAFLLLSLFSGLLFFTVFILSGMLINIVRTISYRQSFSSFISEFSKKTEAEIALYVSSGRLERAVFGAVVLIATSIFFCISKSLIMHINPYSADPALSAFDRALHFDRYPHEYLTGPVNGANLADIIDGFYLLWFPVMFTANAWCIFFERDDNRRMRFLWASFLCGIIGGNLMAVLLSSVGPIYFGVYYPDIVNPYAAFIASLQNADLKVIGVSSALLGVVQNPAFPDFNSISAMPSMHVTVAWLIGLYAWNIHRFVGALAFAFALMILIGSVYLGWHYAIDGYAGILLATGIWWMCGKKYQKT